MAADFIPGVYNYCDRWCERCPLTARCRVFAAEEARKMGDEYYAAFWESFDNLIESGDFNVEQDDEENYLPEVEEWSDREDSENLESMMDRLPLVKMGMDYAQQASSWLSKHAPDEDEPVQTQPAATTTPNIGRQEALEVLRWYLYQIGIKLARALRRSDVEELEISDDEEEFEDEDESDDENVDDILEEVRKEDRDGSAKVALIGIERSLGAWTILRNEFADQSDAILGFQRSLARLRRMIDQQVPGARVFQRPGFDYEV